MESQGVLASLGRTKFPILYRMIVYPHTTDQEVDRAGLPIPIEDDGLEYFCLKIGNPPECQSVLLRIRENQNQVREEVNRIFNTKLTSASQRHEVRSTARQRIAQYLEQMRAMNSPISEIWAKALQFFSGKAP